MSKAFIKEQEATILEYIERLDRINMVAYLQMIMEVANYLICFENRIICH